MLLKSQLLKHALEHPKAQDVLVTEGAWGEDTLQPSLQQCDGDWKAVTAQGGSPRGLLGKQGRWKKEKKQTANEKGTCCKLSVAKHGTAWRAVPPHPVQELGRVKEGPTARAPSRDLTDMIKAQYMPDKACW